MTRNEALKLARDKLSRAGIQDFFIEAEVLLRHALRIDRARLFLELEHTLTPEQESSFFSLIERRLKGEPVAYIIGRREFYGREFYVNMSVLIPRPETEILVDEALKLAKDNAFFVIADIGTGSGVIAVTLALNLPQAKIYATDISAEALEVAKVNARKFSVFHRINFLEGDLLEPLPEECDLIVANLPYVKNSELASLKSEPGIALDGGEDGLTQIRKLIPGLRKKLKPDGYLLLEVGLGQSQAVTDFILKYYPKARIDMINDLARIERVLSVKMAPMRKRAPPAKKKEKQGELFK